MTDPVPMIKITRTRQAWPRRSNWREPREEILCRRSIPLVGKKRSFKNFFHHIPQICMNSRIKQPDVIFDLKLAEVFDLPDDPAGDPIRQAVYHIKCPYSIGRLCNSRVFDLI